MKLNPLNKEEKEVIENKWTERPFTGEYDNFFQKGTFACRRCGALLYRSEDKFDSGCGWPSFDAEITGAVKRMPDADGRRTEIVCARCGAHLGHVFTGEQKTSKNIRHCVNSLSMKFIPEEKITNTTETAYFGGGCFWCTEAVFQKIKGVLSVRPGYAGGNPPVGGENPIYGDVSSGETGHAEVVEIIYDPHIVSYESLLGVFFAVHDPTTPNRQGNDIGTQYRSIILYVDDAQKEIADNFIRDLEKEKIYAEPIVTEIKPLEKFFVAEYYHHDYFAKNPAAAYCQAVINPKLEKMRKKFAELLK